MFVEASKMRQDNAIDVMVCNAPRDVQRDLEKTPFSGSLSFLRAASKIEKSTSRENLQHIGQAVKLSIWKVCLKDFLEVKKRERKFTAGN